MKLKFTWVALNDLKRLHRFIAENDPQAARRYSLRLQTSLEHLLNHPELGKPLEEPVGVRELVAGDYVARYKIDGEVIFILKIRHGKEVW